MRLRKSLRLDNIETAFFNKAFRERLDSPISIYQNERTGTIHINYKNIYVSVREDKVSWSSENNFQKAKKRLAVIGLESVVDTMRQIRILFHDCRVDLTFISSYTELISEEFEGDETPEAVSQLSDHVAKLLAKLYEINQRYDPFITLMEEQKQEGVALSGIQITELMQAIDDISPLFSELETLALETTHLADQLVKQEIELDDGLIHGIGVIQERAKKFAQQLQTYLEEEDQQLDLGMLLAEVAEDIREYANKKLGLKDFDIICGALQDRHFIRAPPTELKIAVLRNIVLNAAQILAQQIEEGDRTLDPEVPPAIYIVLEEQDDNLVVRITDNGPGIDIPGVIWAFLKSRGNQEVSREDIEQLLNSPEAMARLTDLGLEHWQAENPALLVFESRVTARKGGTGVGLDAAAAACRRYGWKISAANLSGEGAEFTIVIPVIPRPRRSPNAPEPALGREAVAAEPVLSTSPGVESELQLPAQGQLYKLEALRKLDAEGMLTLASSSVEQGLRVFAELRHRAAYLGEQLDREAKVIQEIPENLISELIPGQTLSQDAADLLSRINTAQQQIGILLDTEARRSDKSLSIHEGMNAEELTRTIGTYILYGTLYDQLNNVRQGIVTAINTIQDQLDQLTEEKLVEQPRLLRRYIDDVVELVLALKVISQLPEGSYVPIRTAGKWSPLLDLTRLLQTSGVTVNVSEQLQQHTGEKDLVLTEEDTVAGILLRKDEISPTPTVAPTLATGTTQPRVIGADVTEVLAQGTDSSQVQIYLDNDGIIEDIHNLAMEYGLRVYFAGGTARRMLFGKNPIGRFSDVDIMVNFPGRRDDEFTAEQMSRIVQFKQALRERYPALEIDIMNYHPGFGRLGDPYAGVELARSATIDRMLIRKDNAGVWVVSDEKSGAYIGDVKGRSINLVSAIGKDGKAAKLSFDNVLRFTRLIAEFPDAEVDEASMHEINEFVDVNFEDFIRELEDFRSVDRDALGHGVVPPYKILLKVFTNTKNLHQAIELLKNVGVGEHSLYSLFSQYVDLNKIVEIISLARAEGSKVRMSDFDAAFLNLNPEISSLTAHYTMEILVVFLKEELEELFAEFTDEEADKILEFIREELPRWIEQTNNMIITERAIYRYLIKHIFTYQILSSNLGSESTWIIRLDRVVSDEFYRHILEHEGEIYSGIKSGKYKNLVDYYFRVYREGELVKQTGIVPAVPAGSPFAVFQILAQTEAPLTTEQISEKLNRRPSTIEVDLSALIKRNLVQRHGKARTSDATYGLTLDARAKADEVSKLLATLTYARPTGDEWRAIEPQLGRILGQDIVPTRPSDVIRRPIGEAKRHGRAEPALGRERILPGWGKKGGPLTKDENPYYEWLYKSLIDAWLEEPYAEIVTNTLVRSREESFNWLIEEGVITPEERDAIDELRGFEVEKLAIRITQAIAYYRQLDYFEKWIHSLIMRLVLPETFSRILKEYVFSTGNTILFIYNYPDFIGQLERVRQKTNQLLAKHSLPVFLAIVTSKRRVN